MLKTIDKVIIMSPNIEEAVLGLRSRGPANGCCRGKGDYLWAACSISETITADGFTLFLPGDA